MSGTNDWPRLIATETELWQPPPATGAMTTARRRGWGAAILRTLRQWRERERQRREMSMLTERDFGDLALPPSLVRDELRRWPWQKPSPQWAEIGVRSRSGPDGA